jgi:hypothetical protein
MIKIKSSPYGSMWFSETSNGDVYFITSNLKFEDDTALGIYRYNVQQKQLKLITSLKNIGLKQPASALTAGENGMLYGVDMSAGHGNAGAIYSVNEQNNRVEIVYQFRRKDDIQHPQLGLVKVAPDLFYGIGINKGNVAVYSFNSKSKRVNTLQLTTDTLSFAPLLPVYSGDSLLYISARKSNSKSDDCTSLLVYNLNTEKIIRVIDVTTDMNFASGWVKAADGNLYRNSHYSINFTGNAVSMQFLKVNPRVGAVEQIVDPFKDFSTFSGPASIDQLGRVVFSYVYGGPDNCGGIGYLDLLTDTVAYIKVWSREEPGCITSNYAGLFVHSGGDIFAVGSGGDESVLYRMNHSTGKGIVIARFVRQ